MFEKPLGLRENPFLAGHHPKYLFPSREHQEALAHLRYGIQNREPFVLITGEVGTGKTTAVYDALAEWGSRAVVALITNSALTRAELLEEICLRFGVTASAPMSKPQALVELQKQLGAVRARGELAILLVDEAQNLDRELLEEIRLLSNLEVSGEYLLQIFLVGQPELETKLAQKELRQLRQRIGIHYRILPLSVTETARYIHHRVSVAGGNAEELFGSETCVEVYRITNGIPREINIVAGQALLNAFVEDLDGVTPEHVRAVEREIEFQSVLRRGQESGETAVAHRGPARPTPAKAPGHGPARKPPPRPVEIVHEGPPSEAAAPPMPTPLPGVEVPPPVAEPVAASAAVPPVEAPATGRPPGDEMEVVEEDASLPEGYVPHEGLEEIELIPPAPRGADAPRRRSTDWSETPAVAAPEPVAESAPPGLLPSWLDEIIAQRQAIEGASEAREASMVAQSAPAPVPQAPLPPRVVIDSPRPPVAPAPQAAWPPAAEHQPPPARIAPHPSHPSPVAVRLDLISARLRAKLDETGEPIAARRDGLGRLVASLIIAAVAIGVLLMVRFGPWALRPTTSSLESGAAPAVTPTEPPPALMPGDSLDAAVQPADPASTGATDTTPTRATGTATPDPATVKAPNTDAAARPADTAPRAPAPSRPAATATTGAVAATQRTTPPARPSAPAFDVAVGTYLNESRALAERTRLSENSTFPSRVVTVADDTSSVYRVVVGPFSDRTAAERAASDLIQRGLVTEARVIAASQSISSRN